MVAVTTVGFGSIDFGPVVSDSSGTPAEIQLHHLDTVLLPDALEFDGYPVGGLSGIDYAPGVGYVAISDNRGEVGPVRLYTLSLPLDEGHLGTPRFESQINLLDSDGTPYRPRSSDTESVRWSPDGDGFIYTSEGESKVGRPGFIRQADRDGVIVRDFSIPEAYIPRLSDNGELASGIRDNLGFESMTVGHDGGTVVALSENALAQDGAPAGVDTETRSRLLQLDRRTGTALGEYIYPVDKVASGALAMATGVAEIVAVDDDSYLTLERSLSTATGAFTGKIYQTSMRDADNIVGTGAAPVDARQMDKRLLFDFADVGIDPQCVEGMTWGPNLPDGTRTLVVVSDNNFGLAGRTAFHLLSVRID